MKASLLTSRAVLVVVSACTIGCAAKRPVAATHPPAAAQPAAAPAEAGGKPAAGTAVSPASNPNAYAAKSSKTPATPAPVGYTEEGNASWYGNPFHGHRASNGETFDMYKLTAAHRTLPFDTMVRVTNLSNNKSTVVRITDRGPFVENRVIDLSMAAAREIESIGPGVVPVRLEVLGSVDPTVGFFTVQVGAFRDRGNAEKLCDRLNASYTPVFIQQYDAPEGTFYRVRVGKISGERAAQDLAQQLRAKEGFAPLVLRLDEMLPSGGN